jgi:hypothetical protein
MEQSSVAQALDLFSPGSTLETQLRQAFSDTITETLQVGLSSAGIDIVRQEAKRRLNLTSIDQLIMVVPSQAATDGKTVILLRVDTFALLINGVCITVMQQLSEVDTSAFRKSCQPYQDISKFFE